MYINPCATRANKTLHSTAKTTLPPPRVSQSTHSHKAQFLPTPPLLPRPKLPVMFTPQKSTVTLQTSPFQVFLIFSLTPRSLSFFLFSLSLHHSPPSPPTRVQTLGCDGENQTRLQREPSLNYWLTPPSQSAQVRAKETD